MKAASKHLDFELAAILRDEIKELSKRVTSEDKKADKKSDMTQDLFDYVTEQTEAPVASTDPEGTTSETSKTPEPVIDEHETSKHPESIEPICEVVNMSPKETMGFQRDRPTDSPKPINQVSSAILLAR